MKNYAKPVVLANTDLAEGIYAASGADSTCYTVNAYIHQFYSNTDYVEYRIQVNARHNANHSNNKQIVTILFNQPVNYKYSSGILKSGNNTSKIILEYNYFQNPKDNIGFGDLVIDSNPNLSIESVIITDGF